MASIYKLDAMNQHVNIKNDFFWVTPELSRAARAYLGWSLSEIQEKCGISRDVISRFERGATNAKPKLRADLYRIYKDAGVEMQHDGLRCKQ